MNRVFLLNCLLVFCLSFSGLAQKIPAEIKNTPQTIDFIENKGQWVPEAKFKAEIPSGVMFLTETGFLFNFHSLEDLDRIHEITCNSDTLLQEGDLNVL